MYDLIGDIHGHATELEQLLEKLGYEKEEKAIIHTPRGGRPSSSETS